MKHRAKARCDQDSLTQELEFLTTIFKDIGYSPQQIQQAFKPATQTAKTNEKPASIVSIPYTQKTYGWLSRMLAKHIKSISLSPRKYLQLPSTCQGCLGIKNARCVQQVNECDQVYIGQSGRSIQIGIKDTYN